MREKIDKVVIWWDDERERGIFDALADTLRLNSSLPGALGGALYRHNLAQLIDDAVTAYELCPPGHPMRRYLEGYVSEVESVLREATSR
jgi:hypothetical protein